MKNFLLTIFILILNISVSNAQFFSELEEIESDSWTSFDPLDLDELSTMGGDDDGGGWFGGGGSFNRTQDNIWFLGKAPVKYCYLRASDFPISDQEIEELILDSFKEWRTFFNKYEMASKSLRVPRRKNFVLHGGSSNMMSIEFESVGKCQTSEDDGKVGEMLHFNFGVTNKIINGYKFFSTESALGVAIRPKFDHKSYRNGGYVWLEKVSNDKKRIKHLLLHELGHVFGMKHNSVFVMNEDIAYEIKNETDLDSSYFGQIESPGWIYRFRNNDEITLTSLKGIKRKINNNNPRNGGRNRERNRRRNRGQVCEKFDYDQNARLPQFILAKLGIKPKGCHRITLSLKEFPNAELTKMFTLKIELLRGKVFSFKGKFKPIRPDAFSFQGPGVFTLWRDKNTSNALKRILWKRGIVDHNIPSVPSRGFFNVGGNNFAAKINNSKGTQIEIFFPKQGKWWVLNSIHNSFKGE